MVTRWFVYRVYSAGRYVRVHYGHDRLHRDVYVQRVGHRIVRAPAHDVPQQLLAVRKVRNALEHELHVHRQHQKRRVKNAVFARVQTVVAQTSHKSVNHRKSRPSDPFS